MRADSQNLSGKHIVVALSGGVDSAVAAVLLRERGAIVEALHMTNWEDDDGYCTAAEDLQDARRICDALGITLHHVNFAREYREQVFDYFLAEYRRGRTPNPDVLCNREIKFGVFLDYARRLGGDFIATGHYARTCARGDTTWLLKGADRAKDQSYFLHAVDSTALAASIFPLGDLTKAEVRRIARDNALPVFDKQDSTGICFIGERPFREFLATFLPASPGAMETPEGRVMGEHHGLMYYTPGQRRGLGIGGQRDSGGEPWYVADKDLARNALIVVQGRHSLRLSRSLVTEAPGWINEAPQALASGEFQCQARIRYRQKDQPCTLAMADDGGLLVSFDRPQLDVSPGQFAVFYAGDRCLGGAVIAARTPIEEPCESRGKTL